jgi:glycosyltransferase involved in cell wall biosynthesis
MRLTLQQVYRWAELIGGARLLIANNELTRKSLQHAGIPPEQIMVLPLGVDVERFRPLTPPHRPTFRFLYVGSRCARKGFATLLPAWEAQPRPDCELVIAGRRTLRDNEEPRRADGVQYFGPLTPRRLVRAYNEADVLVLPSLAEGFGLSALEALSCGTPVLYSDAVFLADAKVAALDPFHLRDCTIDGVSQAMTVLARDPTVARGRRGESRDLAFQSDWSKIGPRWSKSIGDICS